MSGQATLRVARAKLRLLLRPPLSRLCQFLNRQSGWNVLERAIGALLLILLLVCIVRLVMGREGKRTRHAGRYSIQT